MKPWFGQRQLFTGRWFPRQTADKISPSSRCEACAIVAEDWRLQLSETKNDMCKNLHDFVSDVQELRSRLTALHATFDISWQDTNAAGREANEVETSLSRLRIGG